MNKECILIFFLFTFVCGCSTQMIVLQKPTDSKNQEIDYKFSVYENTEEKPERLKANSIEFIAKEGIQRYYVSWISLNPSSNSALVEARGFDAMGEIETIELSYYSIDDNRELWRITLDEGGNINVEDVIFIYDQHVILKNNQREIICLNLADGNELWRKEEPNTNYISYLKEHQKLLIYDANRDIGLYDPITGDTLWTSNVGFDYPGEPVVNDNGIYFVLDGLTRYDLNQGFKWKSDIVTDYTESNLLTDVAANVIVALLLGRPSYGRTSDPDSYYGCFTTPYVKSDTLYFAALGTLYLIDENSGEILWKTEQLEDFILSNELNQIGHNLYLKTGGLTIFYDGVSKKISYKTIGKQGVAAYNLKKGTLDWIVTTDTLSTGESIILNDYIFHDNNIFMITPNQICALNRLDGSIIKQISSEDLRIGELLKAELSDRGLILKGTEGLSLLDLSSFEPVWSRNVKSFPIAVRPFKADLPLWMTDFSNYSFSKNFYEYFFHYLQDLGIVLLTRTSPKSILGIDINDGSIKSEFPITSDKSVLDLYNEFIFDVGNNNCSFISIKELLNINKDKNEE